jgi:hypothetical protein
VFDITQAIFRRKAVTENPQSEGNLSDEFRALGENLIKALHSVWESPERKKLQQEIEDGLNQLATTLKSEASTFNESPTGQQLKSDFEDLRQRVRSGEAEAKAREELLKALKLINTELDKITSQWGETSSGSEENTKPPSA